jgi:tRNA-dihydrouridine synthase A
MLGRLACDNPYQIAVIHKALYPEERFLTRSELLTKYIDYMRHEYQKGVALSLLVKPIFNLAHGIEGSSQWKQKLMLLLQTKDCSRLDDLIYYIHQIEALKS